MKKILTITLVLFCFLSVTGCDLFKKEETKEVEINTKEMQELPKKAFKELKKYIDDNDIKNIAKNSGKFDIRQVNIGKDKELYLNENSYYYVTNGDIYMYVEYIYDEKYLCKMTINDDEDSIAGFSYHIIDKEDE